MPKSRKSIQRRRKVARFKTRQSGLVDQHSTSAGQVESPMPSAADRTFRQMIAELCREYLPDARFALIQTFSTARRSEYIIDGPSRLVSVHGRWILVAGKSTIRYLTASGMGFHDDQFDFVPGEEAMLTMTASLVMSGPEFHVSLIAPINGAYSVDTANDLSQQREIIREATAMAAVTFGDDFIVDRIYENVIDLQTLQAHLSDKYVSFTVGIANVQGNYDDAGRADMIAVGTAVANMEAQRQRLVTLGLRWFDRSRIADGPLPYLFRWLALNSLSLSIQAKDPVNGVAQLLSESYNISEEEAKTEFALGRLYGLRGQIAHGQADAASTAQQELVRAIFRDSLRACVDLDCRASARAAIQIYGQPF